MNQLKTSLFLALIILCACNGSRNDGKAVPTEERESQEINVAKRKDHAPVTDCVRGKAEPIVIKEVFPNSTFRLQPDNLSAIETIFLENGDQVTIKNEGCESYILSFRFETSEYKADTTVMKYWYVSSYKLLNQIKAGIDAPVDFKKGLEAFNNHISRNVFDLQPGTEIDYGDDDMRKFVSLDRISKTEDDRYIASISFTVGPL